MEWSSHPPEILELLETVSFPVTKVELVAHAEDHDASEEALEIIRAMPDRVYNSLQQINASLGLIEDLPHTDDGWWPGKETDTSEDERRRKITEAKGRGQL